MSTDKKTIVIIMAGGMGKRMNSDLPKVLHKLAGISMMNRILLKLKVLSSSLIKIDKIMIVVGKYRQIIEEDITQSQLEMDNIMYIDQPQALGTGHAIQCCRDELLRYPDSNVLIVSGDVPMLAPMTMFNMIKELKSVKIMVTQLLNPTGYGRIIEQNGIFDKIVEEKDCNNTEAMVHKVNGGIYVFDCGILCKYLPLLNNNNSQHEFYLTDIIEIIKNKEKVDIEMYEISHEKQFEILGVNTIDDLNNLERLLKNNKIS